MHTRLAETMSFVEEKRRELMDSLDGGSGETLCRKAAPDKWSVAEILDHLRMVDPDMGGLNANRVGQAKGAAVGEETSTSAVLPSFDGYSARLQSSVLQSPET